MRAVPASTWRNVAIALAALACLCVVGGVRHALTSAPRAGRPNVVLIVIDTLRPDHLNHYGYARPTAAALDAFAHDAIRFDQAFSTSSWTAPSVASLHTGLLPSRHGLRRYDSSLPAQVTTLAESLQAAGWHTVGHSSNCYVLRSTGFAQGFDSFDDFLGNWDAYPDVSILVDRVTSWLNANPRSPFLLYVHVMNTHGPYRVPGPAKSALLGRRPTREFRYYGRLMADIVTGRRLAARDEVTPAYLESLVEQYDTAIRYTTDQLARVMDALRRAGLYDSSLVIVTADHGEELFDHGGFSHGYSLHGEVVRIPLYVKLPGQHGGGASSARISLVDVVPTVRDVLGLPPLATDGVSLRPLLTGAAAADPWPERPLVHEVDWPNRCVARAIMAGSTKLIELDQNYEGRRHETMLFDVAHDPGERVNLAAARPEVVARLHADLERILGRASATAIGGQQRVRELDTARLRALGYL